MYATCAMSDVLHWTNGQMSKISRYHFEELSFFIVPIQKQSATV